MNESESIISEIKERPHWLIIIRPTKFNETLIESLEECTRIIDKSKIVRNFRHFPFYDIENTVYQNDSVSSFSKGEINTEYWKFFQSGQFYYLSKFGEDDYPKAGERAFIYYFGETTDRSTISGFNDYLTLLYKLTDVMEFACELAMGDLLFPSVSLTIKMNGVKDRILLPIDDKRRSYIKQHKSSSNTLGKEWFIETKKLISNHQELAVEYTQYFYERFGWLNISSEFLKDEQKTYIQGL